MILAWASPFNYFHCHSRWDQRNNSVRLQDNIN